MLKELFPFAFTSDETPAAPQSTPAVTPPTPPPAAPAPTGVGTFAAFDEVYRNAPVKACKVAYSILKIAEMAESSHLAGMSSEAKRSSLLMALEAAGVELDDLLQDAMIRQRALNDYEEGQQKRLKEFEDAKLEENRRIQAELDRITAQHIGKIQANLDEVAHQQDLFRAWQKEKQQEARRITDAAAVCVPQNTTAAGDSLTLVIERVTGPRR